MRAALLALALALAVPAASQAAWRFDSSEDAFSDQVTGTVMGTGGGDVAIGAKCWRGEPSETILMIMTQVPYDQSASYDTFKTIRMRTDSGEIRELNFKVTDLGGSLTFVTNPTLQSEVFEIIRGWASAKKRVAIQIGNANEVIPARGSSAEVGKFVKHCELPTG